MSHQVRFNPPDDLWFHRVDELGLTLEGSPVWPLIQRLYDELAAAGIDFRPPCYVANEWGCPDGQPIIGIPFYLVDPRLHSYEEEHADDLEEDERILIGLRHEAGHALNYAYRIYAESEWTETFGSFGDQYQDDYTPVPFDRRFVRHLPGWYAQKHPDEDFAETFAVWLTPGSNWRERYEGWEALEKLEYVDRAMKKLGKTAPVVVTTNTDPDELNFTVGEYYAQRAQLDAPPVEELGTSMDEDLRELFATSGIGTDAAGLLWDRRKSIMKNVSAFTGARMYVVKTLIDFLTGRLRALGLRTPAGREIDGIAGVTAMMSSLTSNFLRTGHFLPTMDAAGGQSATQ